MTVLPAGALGRVTSSPVGQATVATGTTVARDVPAGAVVLGDPARIVPGPVDTSPAFARSRELVTEHIWHVVATLALLVVIVVMLLGGLVVALPDIVGIFAVIVVPAAAMTIAIVRPAGDAYRATTTTMPTRHSNVRSPRPDWNEGERHSTTWANRLPTIVMLLPGCGPRITPKP